MRRLLEGRTQYARARLVFLARVFGLVFVVARFFLALFALGRVFENECLLLRGVLFVLSLPSFAPRLRRFFGGGGTLRAYLLLSLAFERFRRARVDVLYELPFLYK